MYIEVIITAICIIIFLIFMIILLSYINKQKCYPRENFVVNPNPIVSEEEIIASSTSSQTPLTKQQLAEKYIGYYYNSPLACNGLRVLNVVTNLSAGTIPQFLAMQGVVYKILTPGWIEYMIVDNIDFINNKIKYYSVSLDTNGNTLRNNQCLDFDLRNPNKLVLFSNDPNIKIATFLYENGQYSVIRGNKKQRMTEVTE